MRNLKNVPSEEWNLRTKRLISIKCPIYPRPRLTASPMNIQQESLPFLKPVNLLLGLWLNLPFIALLGHKYLNILPRCWLDQPRACIAQVVSLCYSQLSFRSRQHTSPWVRNPGTVHLGPLLQSVSWGFNQGVGHFSCLLSEPFHRTAHNIPTCFVKTSRGETLKARLDGQNLQYYLFMDNNIHG